MSETLRDIYHSQFGLGGLLQAAELAWQQDEDLYSCWDHALVSAMEMHARIIRAGLANDPRMLPPSFVFGTQDWIKYKLPNNNPPPPGTKWQFEMKVQKWVRLDEKTYKYLETYNGPEKVLTGISFLPCGWEVGYNHYAGRLGLKMPETAALLKLGWPEYQSFHWGLGTLTNSDSATPLWRSGITAVRPS
eukprot:gene1818-2152_t